MAALGDYADAADPDLLTARTFDAHPTGIADLFGLRLAILHETDQGRRLAEGTVKRLTGGDRLKARRMREDFWSFDPSHTFVMLTNHKPIDHRHRRGDLAPAAAGPLGRGDPRGRAGRGLADKLAADLDAVLAFLVAGYADLARERPGRPRAGLPGHRRIPGRVRRARPVHRPSSACPAPHVRSSDLFAAWSKWCAEEGEEAGPDRVRHHAARTKAWTTTRPADAAGGEVSASSRRPR